MKYKMYGIPNCDTVKKVDLLIKNSSAIKRPILESNGQVVCIGFDENILKAL